MASRPFQFWKECGHKFGTICLEVWRGTKDGAFIYALSAAETSPLFSASQPQTTPCFPTASNVLALPGGNLIFAATPTERITHYTLQAKSCAKWRRCPPLETPVLSACGHSPHLRPASPPLQNTKEQRTSAHHHGPICAAPLSGFRAGDEG